MLAEGPHPEGTDYHVVVQHRDPASRARHEELGFADGWARSPSNSHASSKRRGANRAMGRQSAVAECEAATGFDSGEPR